MRNTNFKLSLNSSVNGTSFHDVCIKVDPKKLLNAIGMGVEGDGYKVSQKWHFKHNSGAVFTLYDWKSTNLYDNSNPDTDTYWNSNEVVLHIGHFARNKDLAIELAKELENLCK